MTRTAATTARQRRQRLHLTIQQTLDEVVAVETAKTTLRDIALAIYRQTAEDIGDDTRPEAVLLHRIEGDRRLINIAADLLLMHLEDEEEGELLDDDSLFYGLARIGARAVIGRIENEEMCS